MKNSSAPYAEVNCYTVLKLIVMPKVQALDIIAQMPPFTTLLQRLSGVKMIVIYKIVDTLGDEVDTKFFKPHVDIPMQMQSVRFLETVRGEESMMITLRYLHDKSNDEAFS